MQGTEDRNRGKDGGQSQRIRETCTQGFGKGVSSSPVPSVPLPNNSSVTQEIERALRRGANIPRVKRNKDQVKRHKLKIQKILSALNAPSAPLDGMLSEGVPNLAPADSATSSASGSGTSSAPVFADLVRSTNYPRFSDFNVPACGRLVRRAFALGELPSLIEVIFSSQDESDAIHRLLGDDTQAFIDVIDEARSASARHREPRLIERSVHQALDRPELSPQARGGCLKLVRKMCGRHALLPTSMKTPVPFEQTGNALCRGGFADVWKGEHCGRDVAVKVLRTYSGGDLRKVLGLSCCLCFLLCACALTVPCAEVLQGGCRVESSPPSERPTTDWSSNVRAPVRNDIGLDGEWEYQHLRKSTS